MVQVRIDLSPSTTEVEAALAHAQDALVPPSLTESVGKGADVFVAAVRAAAPRRSGRLAASVDKHPDGATGWKVTPFEIYANIQEEGGTIVPVDDLRLVFDVGGITHVASSVTIPGTHYMAVGFEAGRGPATDAVTAAITSNL